MRFDGVEPARIGRRVGGLDVVRSHERLEASVFVRVEVVHHHVEPDVHGIAGSEAGEDGEQVVDPFVLAHLANEAVGMDIVEGEELLGALQSPVGRPEALRVTGAEPALPGQRSQLERAALVEADDRTVLWALFVEVEDGVFLTS